MNAIQLEDCQNIGNVPFIDWNAFRNSTILITGSTGLLGDNLVNAIAYNNYVKNLGIELILLVRNIDDAKMRFGWTNAEIIRYELGEVLEINQSIDYIVHLASPTDSKFFTSKPVDTMLLNIEGYRALFDWAVKHPVRKIIGLSSMEVYGFPEKGCNIVENDLGAFDPMNTRNSYPIAKIACEALANSYFAQYGVPVAILRATQTFGPGVRYDDGRVFAQFMRCVIEKKDIVLKSKGLTERPYLYTADAVTAILLGLLKAEPGQSYTIANPENYCSIKEMAQMVSEEIAKGEIKVVFDLAEDIEKLGYAKTLYMDLNIEKIKKLGWVPYYRLRTMFTRMILSTTAE